MSTRRVYAALYELNEALQEAGVPPERMPALRFHKADAETMKAVMIEMLVERNPVLAGFVITASTRGGTEEIS